MRTRDDWSMLSVYWLDMGIFSEFRSFWRTFVFILTPLVFLPLPLLIEGTEAACAYGVLIMAVYWLTEAIPLAVTAFLPMVLFPLLGVLPAKEVSVNYMKDINFVFMGGLIMALSIENSNLHTRIALKVLMLMGSKPRWLMLGFMLSTWVLSMWISNTATTAMMIPVVEAVLVQLKISLKQTIKEERDMQINGQVGFDNQALELDFIELHFQQTDPKAIVGNSMPSDSTKKAFDINMEDEKSGPAKVNKNMQDTDQDVELNKKMNRICKMLSLSICYAANVGGVATLTGTAPNLVLSGLAEELYSKHGLESPVTWVTWIPYGLPNSIICLFIAWLWLQVLYLGFQDCVCCKNKKHDPSKKEDRVKRVVGDEYAKLGNIKFSEYANLVLFFILIILWFARNPGFAKGYASLFKPGYVSDSVPAMLVAVMLFVIPYERPRSWLLCKKKEDETKSVPALLSWQMVSTRLPWGPIFILGGGFALADACAKSGLSEVIANAMQVLESLPHWVIVMILVALIATLTEITSNTATTTLVLPILAALADGIGVNPLYLMLPATVAASMAFMLPVATPPNAIVFSYGHLRVIDMAAAGLLMNVLCILVVTLGANTWAVALYDLNTIPWGNTNTTLTNLTSTVMP